MHYTKIHMRIGQLHNIGLTDVKAKFRGYGVNTRRVPRIAQKASIKLRPISIGVLRGGKNRGSKQIRQQIQIINE